MWTVLVWTFESTQKMWTILFKCGQFYLSVDNILGIGMNIWVYPENVNSVSMNIRVYPENVDNFI